MDTGTLVEVVKLLLVAEVFAMSMLAALMLHIRHERRMRAEREQSQAGLRAVVRIYLAAEQAAARRKPGLTTRA